jgi:hypothetical protein
MFGEQACGPNDDQHIKATTQRLTSHFLAYTTLLTHVLMIRILRAMTVAVHCIAASRRDKFLRRGPTTQGATLPRGRATAKGVLQPELLAGLQLKQSKVTVAISP